MCLLQHITPFSQKKVTYCSCYETFYLLTQTDTIQNELEIEIPEHVVTFYLSASKQQYFLDEQINICLRTSGNISWMSKLTGSPTNNHRKTGKDAP